MKFQLRIKYLLSSKLSRDLNVYFLYFCVTTWYNSVILLQEFFSKNKKKVNAKHWLRLFLTRHVKKIPRILPHRSDTTLVKVAQNHVFRQIFTSFSHQKSIMRSRGAFIVLEGCDRSGKSTQSQKLGKDFRNT